MAKASRESGIGHWRWQRISALATLALMVYLTYLVASLGDLDYAAARDFVSAPLHMIALGLLLLAGLFHAALGVQMIIEDYIVLDQGRHGWIMFMRVLFVVLGAASLWALCRIAGIL